MFDDDFIQFMLHLKDKSDRGEYREELADGINLVLSSMGDLPKSVGSSLELFSQQINPMDGYILAAFRMKRLGHLETYKSNAFGKGLDGYEIDENFNIEDLLDIHSKDEEDKVEEVVPYSPVNYHRNREPWLRNYKELVDDGVLFVDETVYYDDGHNRYKGVLLSDGDILSNDYGKAMTVNDWINQYKTTKNSYNYALVDRGGKLVPVNHLRVGDSIGVNAYRLMMDKPKYFAVNGEEFTVSTWRGMLFDYINAVIDIHPDNYKDLVRFSGQLSGVTFIDEGVEIKKYQLKSELELDNGRSIYIVANRMTVIRAIAQITVWINDIRSDDYKVKLSFVF